MMHGKSMSHKLGPHVGAPYLSPREVVARLQAEFRSVKTDAEEGAAHLGQMIELLRGLNAPEAILQTYATRQSEALEVQVADDDSAAERYIHFLVVPEGPLLVGYSAPEHEEACQPLVKRCARVLNYGIFAA